MIMMGNGIRRVTEKAQTYGIGFVAQKGYAHALSLIASPLTKHLLKAEYRAQRADVLGPNERPLEYSFALRALALCQYQDVLDVGPGTSPWPALLATCGYHVTAIDEMEQYWSGSITNKYFHVIRDNVLCPKINSKFGIVTCISTLEHILAHQQAVASMAELLKDRGILVLSFPYNERSYVANAYELPEALNYARHVNYTCQVYNRETINSWLEASGLRLELQQYFRVFTGEYWGCGKRLRGCEVTVDQLHHLTAVVLRRG